MAYTLSPEIIGTILICVALLAAIALQSYLKIDTKEALVKIILLMAQLGLLLIAMSYNVQTLPSVS